MSYRPFHAVPPPLEHLKSTRETGFVGSSRETSANIMYTLNNMALLLRSYILHTVNVTYNNWNPAVESQLLLYERCVYIFINIYVQLRLHNFSSAMGSLSKLFLQIQLFFTNTTFHRRFRNCTLYCQYNSRSMVYMICITLK